MTWQLKARSVHVRCSVPGFHAGVEVWIRRPNVVDKKLLGSVMQLEGRLSPGWMAWVMDPTSGLVTMRELTERWSEGRQSSSVGRDRYRFVVRALLPRRKQLLQSYELVVTDENSVSFFQLKTSMKGELEDVMDAQIIPWGAYKLILAEEEGEAEEKSVETFLPVISLYIHEPCPPSALEPTSSQAAPSPDWLAAVLLPKLVQWSTESSSSMERVCPTNIKDSPLIPLDRYVRLYQELKDKYGPFLIKNWPDGTDPFKFVYEDIAIATYLLVMWEEERKEQQVEERQSFVDLGCGNGLLVYLLSREGHPGRGLDLRKRRTWNLYSKFAELQVCTLTPSASTLFPEDDWLLGNHSDELTPWLPVMAARSSYKTQFFVLPCCPYDFNRKFHRQVSGVSQYRSYLDYVWEIGERMGFKMLQDTLRIPSSKRVCLIGRQRTYPAEQESVVDARRRQFINDRCGSGCGPDSEGWCTGFSPRVSVEPVRNCTQVARHLTDSIINTVATRLLHTECWMCGCPPGEGCRVADGGSVMCAPGKGCRVVGGGVTCSPGDSCASSEGCGAGIVCGNQARDVQECPHPWNVGGKLALCDVAAMFEGSVLKQLKKECGGLQTLLRNQHQVFHVQAGCVTLHNWSIDKGGLSHSKNSQTPHPASCRDSKTVLHKTKLCWFNEHHPQGCPRLTHSCPYAHGLTELRQRPDFKNAKAVLEII